MCHGSGIDPYIEKYQYPFEMNVANKNFGLIWNSLGLDKDANSIHPLQLLSALASVRPELMERKDRNYTKVGPNGQPIGARSFEFGVDAERVQYYIDKLNEIGEEAARREELIIWC